MHRLMFGHSFAELVALILLPGLAFYFLNKKKACVRRNEEDANTGAPGSMTAPAQATSGGSSSLRTGTNNEASSPSLTETNSGASSSSTESTGNCYEVFLSFRGADTRHGFTDHLYHGFLRVGINAFRDDDELCHGEDIRPKLVAAITNSKILIPIFSESYGTSSWCLDELVEIMERKNNDGQIVLPIFYKVKPSDVGHQRGSFGDAFLEREKRLLERPSFDPTILKKWKKALLEVSKVKGYEAHGDRSEVGLVNLVVQKVLRELKKNFELVISKNLVGIESHVKKVMELIDDKSHAPLFVGIHGMGGIGKTTLAKAIYNKLSNQFEHRSFIADIRESWKSGIHQLQKKLISDILQQEIAVHDENEGTNIISSRLKGKKVLLLLDDVDNVDQVRRLAGNHDWFSWGSRIIITTRNKRILEVVEVDYEYDLKEMDYDQSLILFSKHAFRMDSPRKDFEDLTHEVVSIAGGLPLCLEVFGSLFCGKESTEWRHTIEMLKKVPCSEVKERLRISYEALNYRQKQIFLDIACFFIGTDMRITSYMWEACDFFPRVNIEVLRFLSLIKIEDDHELGMHDHLRDLGRAIVREIDEQRPWHHSRLWDSNEALKVLKTNKGTEKIEAIDMTKGSSYGRIYTDKQFKNLTSLRFLHMEERARLSGDFEDSMDGLKWLRWKRCPENFEVNNFHPTELAILELQRGAINERWQGWSYFKMAEKLKFLDLAFCESLETTDFLSAFKNLEVLILAFCKSLRQIDSSIGEMKALLRLELCCCYGLTELPPKIGKLKALEKLNLYSTSGLSALPDSIVSLQNLEILDISYSGIRELPNDVGRLRQLRELDASACRKMKGELPESIGSLENLEILDISSTGIRGLPESMCNLSSLQHFDVRGCNELQSLPDHLPSNLTYLGVTCQSRILPSLSHLTRLKELRLDSCEFLECITEFPPMLLKNLEFSQLTDVEESELPQSLNTPFKLEILHVSKCESIEILDVSQLIHLSELFTDSCKNLLEVRVLDRLTYLESLTITACNSRLDVPQFGSLKKLDVRECENLVEIQGLDGLVFLEELSISKCASIERLLLPKSRGLKILKAEWCMNLAKIHGLGRLEFLERLIISDCASIEKLHLPKSKRLHTLPIKCCKMLVEIQGLDRLEFLEELSVTECASIQRLELPKSGSLKQLYVSDCEILVEIQGLDRLQFLERPRVSKCASIQRLELPKSGSLNQLDVSDCELLVEIQGLDRLEFLEKLSFSKCASIQRLELPKSGSLNRLDVSDCELLVEIQGLDWLEFLEKLSFSKCASIQRLELPKAGSLNRLDVSDCELLVEIQGLDRLEFLEELSVSKCASIERLELPKSGSLKRLYVSDCETLVEIQGLNRLEFLEELSVSKCASIQRLELPKSRSLNQLDVSDCELLVEIQGLDRLEFLEALSVSKCASIQRLELPKSGSLNQLDVSDCELLVEIQGLDWLEFLEELSVSKCTSIERLDLPKSGSLKGLHVSDCKILVEIEGLDRLEFLEELSISQCASIESLPVLCCLDNLRTLTIDCWDKLQGIQSLERFPSCKSLWIGDCTSLAKLPNLSGFHNLQKLFLSNCHELREIPGLEESISLKFIAISRCSSLEILPDLSSCTCLISLIVQNCEQLTELRGLEKLEHLEELDISGCKSLKTISELPGTQLYQNYENDPSESFREFEF